MSKQKCKHCGCDIALRNPSGYCDHLSYPENCDVCSGKTDTQEKGWRKRMKYKNILCPMCGISEDVISRIESSAYQRGQKDMAEQVRKEVIGEDETPESYLPKFLSESELSMAHQAVEFHGRNELRAEQRTKLEQMEGK